MEILKKKFYINPNVQEVAKELLGKVLCTKAPDGEVTAGRIVETEAYDGVEDRACHAFNNRRTKRTLVMYEEGGIGYVYFCYGIHYLFNVVTSQKNSPKAVLIRAIEPLLGIEIMLKRRKKQHLDYALTSGPGSVTRALGIDLKNNGQSLTSSELWIASDGYALHPYQIIEGPRVGIAYAKEFAIKPWRYRIKDNPWASKINPIYAYENHLSP